MPIQTVIREKRKALELTDQEITRVCEDVVKEIKDSGFGAGFYLVEKL